MEGLLSTGPTPSSFFFTFKVTSSKGFGGENIHSSKLLLVFLKTKPRHKVLTRFTCVQTVSKSNAARHDARNLLKEWLQFLDEAQDMVNITNSLTNGDLGKP